MKKLFFTLCALCLCGTMWGLGYQQTAWTDSDRDATTVYEDANNTGLSFYVLNGEAVLTWKDASESNYSSLTSLILPETVSDGSTSYTVTKVGDYAFYKASTIEGALTIPANINTLGRSAFEECTKITSVIIEYAETNLANSNNQNWGTPFYSCSGITTVTLNRNLTQGRSYSSGYRTELFSDLTNIETVYIGENVTEILHDLFNCDTSTSCKLETVYCYSSTVPSLGSSAFDSHTGLTLHVCKSLGDAYSVSDWATYFSTIINDLDDPGLEEGTYCDLTTGLYFEINEDETTASIYHDELGVYDDKNLVSHSTISGAYTLPERVSADGETYYNVTRVEAEAFANSSISGHLVIPANIVNMGTAAFAYCTQLTEVTYEYGETPLYEENTNNGSNGSFSNCTGIATVNLYRDVTINNDDGSTLEAPFVWQNSIKTVNIGPRVTHIPSYMFRDHNSSSTQQVIEVINCYSINPPSLGTAPFDDLTSGYMIYVPFGAESLYTDASSPWATYATEGHVAELDNAFAITTHANNDNTAYATFYNSLSDVELFDDGTGAELTAYVAYQLDEEDDGLYIEIESIGNTVPAGTGVIVETEKAGTYLAIATGEKSEFTATNDLYGYDEATEIDTPSVNDYYFYLLSSYNEQVGFYYGATGGAAFTCQAHRAYLAIPKGEIGDEDGNESNGISIRKGNGGEDTTGISSVESATEGASVKGIYTIQGVRVSNMNQPGLYIVDGRKVLVK